jgi:hypothetical protein
MFVKENFLAAKLVARFNRLPDTRLNEDNVGHSNVG